MFPLGSNFNITAVKTFLLYPHHYNQKVLHEEVKIFFKGLVLTLQICLLVWQISASFQYNCANNGKGLKIGTKEADTTEINNRLGAFRKIKYFGDIPRQLLCIRDLTIKSKLFKNMLLSYLFTI